jgi:nitrogen regulatory protein PII
MATEMILIVFNASIEDEVKEALEEAGMDCYTKLPGLQGEGSCSEPRLDSHVWPGTNTMYLIVAESAERERVLQAVRKIKEIHREEGVSAFVLPVTGTV